MVAVGREGLLSWDNVTPLTEHTPSAADGSLSPPRHTHLPLSTQSPPPPDPARFDVTFRRRRASNSVTKRLRHLQVP